MKKDILKLTIEIIVVFFLVMWSIPVWDTFAKQIKDINFEQIPSKPLRATLLNDFDTRLIVSNNDYHDLNSAELIVYNEDNKVLSGRLVFKYARLSTLDYNYINIKINDQVTTLSSLLMTSSEAEYIFVVDEFDIRSMSKKEYEITIWLNNEPEADIFNKYYDYSLEVITIY